MIDYVGDISKQDAVVLAALASSATNILEFGSGASTQVLAAYGKCPVLSVETSAVWIKRTRGNLERLGLPAVQFTSYADWAGNPTGEYDLIFDDGVDGFRLEFAFAAWKLLKIDGIFAFHDTRRFQDVANVVELLRKHSPEIRSVIVNKDHSNITTFRKKEAEFYDDWNVSEQRTPAQIRGE